MAIHLQRVDASRNLYRYYRLDMQPDLFGQVSLIREWGRIGQGGTVRITAFDTEREAVAELEHALTIKQQRGYGLVARCPEQGNAHGDIDWCYADDVRKHG